MEENKNIELTEETNSCDCNCEEQDINETFISLEIEKDLDRLERLYLFDDESKDAMANGDEFNKGIEKALYYAGFYNTLVSFGIPEEKSFELVINQQTIDHNLLANKLTNETSIKVSENQAIQIEKNSL